MVRRLCCAGARTSYVDLVFCHREDLSTPIEETVRAMSFIVDKGQALYWVSTPTGASQGFR